MANEALKGYDEDTLSSHEIMANIGDAERDRFVKFQELFESPGWVLLKEYFTAQANAAVLQGFACDSWEKNREFVGEYGAYSRAADIDVQFMNEFENIARQNIEALEQEYDPA